MLGYFDNAGKLSGFKKHEMFLYQLKNYQLIDNTEGFNKDSYDASFTVPITLQAQGQNIYFTKHIASHQLDILRHQ